MEENEVVLLLLEDGSVVVEFEEMTPNLLRLLADTNMLGDMGDIRPCVRFGLGYQEGVRDRRLRSEE